MSLNLRIRLSAMMFLEFFVWGAWVTVLSNHLDALQLGANTPVIYGLLGLASLFMPIVAGQITDRFVPTQLFLAAAHLAGAVGLFLASQAGSAKDYGTIYWGMFIWALAYAPTISLTNSLAFTHIKDPEKDFSTIRLFGTIGWIASNWALTGWRNIPSLKIGGNDCLYLAAGASVVMAVFCLFLPHTPPAKTGVSPFAFAKAFRLLLKPQVSLFLVVAFLVGVAFYFYFTLIGPFLAHVGAKDKDIPALQSIGNFSEILAMLLLPVCLKSWGPSITIALGALFGALRYTIFAFGEPYGLVVGALFTHGFYFTYFFVVGFIYIDMAAPKDIKGSAQGLLTLVVFGLSAFLGNQFIAQVQAAYRGRPDEWAKVWLVPALIAVACAILFLVTFPKGSMKKAAGAEEQAQET